MRPIRNSCASKNANVFCISNKNNIPTYGCNGPRAKWLQISCLWRNRLASQMETVQSSGQPVNWVVHSRAGAEFVQAAAGSTVTSLNNNSVVFHSGANNQIMTDSVMVAKEIGDVIDKDYRYRDAPNDLVPQIIGLRALDSPLNFISSLLYAPYLSSVFFSIQQSPHTLPYQWNNLQTETK